MGQAPNRVDMGTNQHPVARGGGYGWLLGVVARGGGYGWLLGVVAMGTK